MVPIEKVDFGCSKSIDDSQFSFQKERNMSYMLGIARMIEKHKISHVITYFTSKDPSSILSKLIF